MTTTATRFDPPKGPKGWRQGTQDVALPTMPKAERARRNRGQSNTAIANPPVVPKADRLQADQSMTAGGYKPLQQRAPGEPGLPFSARSNFRSMGASTSMPRGRLPIVPEHETLQNPIAGPALATEAKSREASVAFVAPVHETRASRPPTAPKAQASGGWGVNAASRFFSDLVSSQMEVDLSWYCPTRRVSGEEKQLIERTALDIAKQYKCNVVCIRSDIHATTNAGTRDAYGRKDTIPAPWHYTVEFQHFRNKMWMTAHVYTDTVEEEDEYGYRVKRTKGLRAVDGVVIKKNPEMFEPHRNFNHKSHCFENYTFRI